jgi:hypothetical protein
VYKDMIESAYVDFRRIEIDIDKKNYKN